MESGFLRCKIGDVLHGFRERGLGTVKAYVDGIHMKSTYERDRWETNIHNNLILEAEENWR